MRTIPYKVYPRGHKVKDTLDEVSDHNRGQSHTQTQAMDNSEDKSAFNMSLDWRRKPKFVEETPEAWENTQTTYTHRVKIGIKPPNPEANMLNTKPPV